jgi:hypothetical protein
MLQRVETAPDDPNHTAILPFTAAEAAVKNFGADNAGAKMMNLPTKLWMGKEIGPSGDG